LAAPQPGQRLFSIFPAVEYPTIFAYQNEPGAFFKNQIIGESLDIYGVKSSITAQNFEFNCETLPENEVVKIFPNPSLNEVTISSSDFSAPKKLRKIMLINNEGLTVKSFTIDSEKFTFDISDLPKGTYLLKIIYDNERDETRRIVIQ